jgi:hypothetical protein
MWWVAVLGSHLLRDVLPWRDESLEGLLTATDSGQGRIVRRWRQTTEQIEHDGLAVERDVRRMVDGCRGVRCHQPCGVISPAGYTTSALVAVIGTVTGRLRRSWSASG